MILVCGEALIDLFIGPAEGVEMPARAVPGGSPFNVAIGLARLDIRSGFLGCISRDRFGILLADVLAKEGVTDRFIVRSDRPSTISAVATGPDGQPTYSFHGEGAADRAILPADVPESLPDEVEALTFGSFSMVVEPGGSTFAELAERERGRRVISIDPNLRPAVVGDLARWAAASERYFRAATIVKASDEDVRIAWSGRATIGEAAAFWRECGARLVVITRGSHGATAFADAGEVSVPAPKVAVRDTVGAGDSFHAALLARLSATGRLDPDSIGALDRDAIADLVAYGNAAAGITCTRKGADLPTAAEVAALYPAAPGPAE
jgi:fructokinase